MHSKVFFRPIEDSSDDDDPSTLKKKRTALSGRKLFRSASQTTAAETSKCGAPSTPAEANNSLEPLSNPVVVSPDSSSSSPSASENPSEVKTERSKSNDNSSIKSQTTFSFNVKKQKNRLRNFSWSHVGSKAASIPEVADSSNDKVIEASSPPSLDEEEDDPVMALFEARTTQRVRFSLDDEPNERGRKRNVSGNAGDTTINSPSSAGKSIIKESITTNSNKSSFNIKKFMKSALFGTNGKPGKAEIEEFEEELKREIETATENTTDGDKVEMQTIVWASSSGTSTDQGEASPSTGAVHVAPYIFEGQDEIQPFLSSFEEDHETRANFLKLLNKARRAQFVYYRYQYAVRTYIKALALLKNAKYPDSHPAVVKTMKSLNNAYFAVSSLKNSANIVKLGIKYEDSGELVRALKMYTIAYRIRRDNLSASHPSLVVLLNMLGSIQIKRGELQEAMAIYELALKDSGPSLSYGSGNDDGLTNADGESSEQSLTRHSTPIGNFLTRSVAYREMGTVYQEWGEMDKALEKYHKSLDCMAHYKGISDKYENPLQKAACLTGASNCKNPTLNDANVKGAPGMKMEGKINDPFSGEMFFSTVQDEEDMDAGGMELTFTSFAKFNASAGTGKKVKKSNAPPQDATPSCYDVFFPLKISGKKHKKKKGAKTADDKKGDYTDVEIAQTIHRIAQLHRSGEQYDVALPIFYVALRGMKYSLGKTHPNVAAILGNIGNLLKEMGDMDAAYQTYQQVLAIESYRLGLSHPDVVITLHNIATIDAARGNLDHALALYKQVLSLQRKLFGEEHESVAVTSACMGDVYERTGDAHAALECYEEALRITIFSLGRHSLEVARLLHKLGKLAVAVVDYHLALSYLTKAALVYRLNKLRDDDEWVVDVSRDIADVEASIAMGRGVYFEC